MAEGDPVLVGGLAHTTYMYPGRTSFDTLVLRSATPIESIDNDLLGRVPSEVACGTLSGCNIQGFTKWPEKAVALIEIPHDPGQAATIKQVYTAACGACSLLKRCRLCNLSLAQDLPG